MQLQKSKRTKDKRGKTHEREKPQRGGEETGRGRGEEEEDILGEEDSLIIEETNHCPQWLCGSVLASISA